MAMKEIFDSYVENAFCSYEQAAFKFNQFEYNYKKFFPQSKDVPVLDIGIGRGEMLSCMDSWGYRNYLGVDISPSTIEFCRALGLNCVQVDNTITWLNENTNKFALISLIDVLEHIHKDEVVGFLKSIKKALLKKGVLIIQVPNLQAPDGQLHRYNDFTHESGFIEHSLGQVLLTAGFKTFDFHGFETLALPSGCRTKIRKAVRCIYWAYVRFTRNVNCNLNPKVLHPVFYAVARKSDS